MIYEGPYTGFAFTVSSLLRKSKVARAFFMNCLREKQGKSNVIQKIDDTACVSM